MKGVRITDTDRGYKRVMRAADGSRQGRRLRVGVKGDQAVQDIAMWQEFGTATIPARSFLRAWFDSNRDRIAEDLRGVAREMLFGAKRRDELLIALGHKYRDEIQGRILAGINPELAPGTVIEKERHGDPETPLVTEAAHLLSSIVAMLDEEVV